MTNQHIGVSIAETLLYQERLAQMAEFEVAAVKTRVLKPRDCYRDPEDESQWIQSSTRQLFQLWVAGGQYVRDQLHSFKESDNDFKCQTIAGVV
jgi:hypothetical protein